MFHLNKTSFGLKHDFGGSSVLPGYSHVVAMFQTHPLGPRNPGAQNPNASGASGSAQGHRCRGCPGKKPPWNSDTERNRKIERGIYYMSRDLKVCMTGPEAYG